MTVRVATPVAETFEVPSVVGPSWKVTVPENVPPEPVDPLAATVAVKTSDAPAVAGLALAVGLPPSS